MSRRQGFFFIIIALACALQAFCFVHASLKADPKMIMHSGIQRAITVASPDFHMLATMYWPKDQKGELCFYDVGSRNKLYSVAAPPGAGIAWLKFVDGNTLDACVVEELPEYPYYKYKVCSLNTATRAWGPRSFSIPTFCAPLSKQGEFIGYFTKNGNESFPSRIHVWNLPQQRRILDIETSLPGVMDFAPDGKSMVVSDSFYKPAYGEIQVRLIDMHTGQTSKVMKLLKRGFAIELTYSPDSKLLVITCPVSTHGFDLESGKELWNYSCQTQGHPSFSSTGKFLAIRNYLKGFELLEAKTGKHLSSASILIGDSLSFFDKDSKIGSYHSYIDVNSKKPVHKLSIWDLNQNKALFSGEIGQELDLGLVAIISTFAIATLFVIIRKTKRERLSGE